ARLCELAEALGEAPERIASALTACAPTCSIDADENAALGAYDETDSALTRLDLDRALGMLEPLERRLILLRYRHELSQSSTGKLLSMSQVQVSRREKKALENLRAILT
ncbi:MAG: sigma-70 family RNA polymerase sigma factor, partial [Clostridia bacterium]|nr:sigma-70 family RNA polymerase sigma factor [Clostridia bacterium]